MKKTLFYILNEWNTFIPIFSCAAQFSYFESILVVSDKS